MFILIWFFFTKNTSLCIFYYYIFFMLMIKSIFMTGECCFSNHLFFFAYDYFSIILIILSFIIILMSSFFIKSHYLWYFKMTPLLCIIFSSLNILFFFIFFEMSLIPILMLFSLLGTYKERFLSLVYFFIFTSFSGMPLMITIIMLIKNNINNYLFLSMLDLKMNEIIVICIFLGFMAKLPVFGVHYWLPKAHVDAPTGGSMILAGVLLKLGGFGFLRLMMILPLSNLYFLFSILGAMGYFMSSFICLRLIDYKVIVAYSSVSHMSLAFSGLMLSFFFSSKGAFLMFIGHGIVSPMMFFFSHILYKNMNTRDITIMKGFMHMNLLSFFFIFFFFMNLGLPPFINFWGEFYIMYGLFFNFKLAFFFFFMGFMTNSIYSIYLMTTIMHSKMNNMFLLKKQSFLEKMMCFYSTFLLFLITFMSF
uniref:NADH-ubiquinone oxidoreductase chain 4 n=1 Tax=Diplosoma listerianum TaxID=168635 RepID=D1GL12_9ASCI|nr:NADH dehydrogenase subunit 4 [Diplosoma listerianum]